MPTVLVTGANRGLGLEFVRQYKAEDWEVIATARQSSPELDQLGVRLESLDMSDHAAVASFDVGEDLDLLIANAGTYGPRDASSGEEAAEWLDTFAVNTIAPYLLAKAVLPKVQARRGKLIAISTRMGSIADNSSGGFLAYRSSKTGLNMAWRTLALANRELTCAVLHPGWVQTRMGGANAPLEPEESVSGMRRVIEGLNPTDSGEFFDYSGKHVPW